MPTNDYGYWFSTENGVHIFARNGQSKADAISEFNEYHKNYYNKGNNVYRYDSIKTMFDSKIFQYYFSRLSLNKTKFSKDEKTYFVNILKSMYDEVEPEHLEHYLIPNNPDYLKDSLITTNNSDSHITINYIWPTNQGFLDSPTPKILAEGFLFDRFGSPQGSFSSPIINNKSFSISERALPYYIPKNKIDVLYHKYEVLKDFSKLKSSIESYYDPYLSESENKLEKSILLKEYYDFSIQYEKYKQRPGYANIGKVAPAFDGGGGLQVELPMRIISLLKLKMIKEVK